MATFDQIDESLADDGLPVFIRAHRAWRLIGNVVRKRSRQVY
jgi:hypothetical protein